MAKRRRVTNKAALARIAAAALVDPDAVRRDQDRRRSSAASPHRSVRNDARHPGKGTRHNWRREL